MADNASQRAIEIDKVLHRLQNHPDSIQMLSQVELLQQEVKELVPRLRQPILQLGKMHGLGSTLKSSYTFASSWTSSELQSWLESYPTSNLPTKLPEYKPPKLHYVWHTAFEDERPHDILLVVKICRQELTLRWNTDRMQDKIDLEVHRQIAEQLFNITGKRVMLEHYRNYDIQLYPNPEHSSLLNRITLAFKSIFS